MSALDGHVTPWDNQCCAFLGDVTQDVATTVVFPVNAFATTINTLVYREDCTLANLDAFNGVNILPASNAN